jgi:hypothetical protein
METNQFTNYEFVINVMRSSHQRAGLTWDTNGFANLVGLSEPQADI